MSLIIGLTGSIGTGKSTIAEMFEQLNIPVVDADKIARLVVEPGEAAYDGIVEAFGEGILFDDGRLNRQALGNIVFSDEKQRQRLNEIIHPAIRQEMIEQRDHYVAQGEPVIVLDIPLLYENNLTWLVDQVIVVSTSEDVQLQRILTRDHSSREEALQRIQSQLSITEKVMLADAVIDNNGTIEASFQQLKDILQRWAGEEIFNKLS